MTEINPAVAATAIKSKILASILKVCFKFSGLRFFSGLLLQLDRCLGRLLKSVRSLGFYTVLNRIFITSYDVNTDRDE